MLTEQELRALIADLESDRVERTTSTKHTDKHCQAICDFANDFANYRNPIVAEAMKSLGYVNRYGRGVHRAQRALRENGNPPAEFQFGSTHFLALIRKRA